MLKPHYFLLLALLGCQPAGLPNDGAPEPQPEPSTSATPSVPPVTSPTEPTASAEPSSEPTVVPTAASSPGPIALPIDVNFHERIDVQEGFRLVFPDGLQFRFRLENDSRCPRNVTCIWAGEVTLALELQKEGESLDSSQSLALRGGEESAILTWKNYDITLYDVKPYPEQNTDAETAETVATVEVSPHTDG